jgi:hypothetical protein
VRADGIVLAPPCFDEDFGLLQGVEDFANEAPRELQQTPCKQAVETAYPHEGALEEQRHRRAHRLAW